MKVTLYDDKYCCIKYDPQENQCFYFVKADLMLSFIPMSYSVGKYIASRMKSNMKFAYKCLDKLEGRI